MEHEFSELYEMLTENLSDTLMEMFHDICVDYSLLLDEE